MADKYLRISNLGTIEEVEASTVSQGDIDAGKIVAVGNDGKIDLSMLPDEVLSMIEYIEAKTAETLTKGDLVYIYWDGSEVRCKKAKANDIDTIAQGFVREDVPDGEICKVYFEGTVSRDDMTFNIGSCLFLSNTDAGKPTETSPANQAGTITQRVGSAISSNSFQFERSIPIIKPILEVDGGASSSSSPYVIDGGGANDDEQTIVIDGGNAAE